MYSFLVLGLIPGTNIQIGFWTWIVLMLVLAIAFKRYKRHLIKHLGHWWHQFDEEIEGMPRQPLPANRLHLRGL